MCDVKHETIFSPTIDQRESPSLIRFVPNHIWKTLKTASCIHTLNTLFQPLLTAATSPVILIYEAEGTTLGTNWAAKTAMIWASVGYPGPGKARVTAQPAVAPI